MICAVIVAGGSGARMRAPVKKQYLQLDDLPILSHTLLAFDRCGEVDKIIVVLPEEDLKHCRYAVLAPLVLNHDIQLVAGGQRRQDSVVNGLNALAGDDGVVMVHDGVRPFVRSSLIKRCLAGVEHTGACIPALAATDTLKKVDANNVVVGTVQRQTIRLAQTPQTFTIDLIRRAHRQAAHHRFAATDDAAVAEYAGASVRVVPGDPHNIKITTPHDLVVARAILESWRMDTAAPGAG